MLFGDLVLMKTAAWICNENNLGYGSIFPAISPFGVSLVVPKTLPL